MFLLMKTLVVSYVTLVISSQVMILESVRVTGTGVVLILCAVKVGSMCTTNSNIILFI